MDITERIDKHLNEKTQLRKKAEPIKVGIAKEISDMSANVVEKLNDIKVNYGDKLSKKEMDALDKAKEHALQSFSTISGEFSARFDKNTIKKLKKK